MTYEYKKLVGHVVTAELNELGAKGWRVVAAAIDGGGGGVMTIILMREIAEGTQ